MRRRHDAAQPCGAGQSRQTRRIFDRGAAEADRAELRVVETGRIDSQDEHAREMRHGASWARPQRERSGIAAEPVFLATACCTVLGMSCSLRSRKTRAPRATTSRTRDAAARDERLKADLEHAGAALELVDQRDDVIARRQVRGYDEPVD